MDNPSKFYVYAYLRSRPSKYGEVGSPYYIGKGSRNRRFSKLHNTKPPQDPANNVLLKEHLTEQEAFSEEIRLIKLYGRIDLGTGCLRNRTDGGEGNSGRMVSLASREKQRQALIGRSLSAEHKNKIRLAELGRVPDPEAIEKTRLFNLGTKHSLESKERMRLAHLGKTHSADTKERIRQAAVNCSIELRDQRRRARQGKTHSLATREKLRLAKLGNKHRLGHKHSSESIEKMRLSKRKVPVADIG